MISYYNNELVISQHPNGSFQLFNNDCLLISCADVFWCVCRCAPVFGATPFGNQNVYIPIFNYSVQQLVQRGVYPPGQKNCIQRRSLSLYFHHFDDHFGEIFRRNPGNHTNEITIMRLPARYLSLCSFLRRVLDFLVGTSFNTTTCSVSNCISGEKNRFK